MLLQEKYEKIMSKCCKCSGKMKFICENGMDYAECTNCHHRILLAIH